MAATFMPCRRVFRSAVSAKNLIKNASSACLTSAGRYQKYSFVALIQHRRQARSDRIAGVMLLDLVPGNVLQGELDLEEDDHRDRTKLMVALDTINQRYGKGTVHSGATGGTNKGKDWGMKQERRTPQYTTRWEDVPVARA